MEKKKIEVSLKAVNRFEMDEEDVRLELEIYNDNYIPTDDDWKEAIDKRINFYLKENYFIKEKNAKIEHVWYRHLPSKAF